MSTVSASRFLLRNTMPIARCYAHMAAEKEYSKVRPASAELLRVLKPALGAETFLAALCGGGANAAQ